MGRLWFGNRPVTLLVGDNRTVNIDTSLDENSTNPVTNKAIATEIGLLNSEILNLKSDLFNANQEIDTLTLALESSDSEIATLKQSLNTCNSEIATLKEQVQTLTSSLNTLRSEFDTHVTYLGTYQTSVADRFSTVETRLEALESNESYNEGILDDEGYTNLEDLFG